MILSDFIDLVVRTASGAFIDVTVFVGLALFVFGFINFKKRGGLVRAIEEKSWCKGFVQKCFRRPSGGKMNWCQPLIGALLGLTPGCGGAILIMPLYVRKQVSFGAVVATLIATAGDAAFVLIAEVPMTFLYVSMISFVVAVLVGTLVDVFEVGKKLIRTRGEGLAMAAEKVKSERKCCKESLDIKHIGHEAGDEIDEILHRKAKHHQHVGTLGYKITHNGYLFYWGFLLVGLVFGVMNLFSFDYGEGLMWKIVLYLGVLGTLASIVLMIAGKKFLGDDTHEETESKMMSFKETVIHNAEETAFVGVWVFVAFMVYEIFVFSLGGGNYGVGEEIVVGFMGSVGLMSIFVAALVGMIPGCGPQVILVSLYTKGLFPFAALIAHTISQDGDALFPLLALDKRAAFWATVITTAVAAGVGVAWWFLV